MFQSIINYKKNPNIPRHIRELFIKSTCGSQTFPSDRYISPEKWNTLIKFSIDKINPNLTIDDIEVIFRLLKLFFSITYIRENQRAQIMRTKFGTDPLFHLLENFCHMFKWDYSDWLNDMKNNSSYKLNNAMDDLLSFISMSFRFTILNVTSWIS